MLRILIIDDSENDIFLFRAALDRENIKNPIHFVTNGREAVEYLRGEGKFTDRNAHPLPSFIMTDLNMPHMDGFAVLKWLKAQPAYSVIPTMVFTTSNEERDIERAYRCGANAYMVKPDTLRELCKAVRTVHNFWNNCKRPRVDVHAA